MIAIQHTEWQASWQLSVTPNFTDQIEPLLDMTLDQKGFSNDADTPLISFSRRNKLGGPVGRRLFRTISGIRTGHCGHRETVRPGFAAYADL